MTNSERQHQIDIKVICFNMKKIQVTYSEDVFYFSLTKKPENNKANTEIVNFIKQKIKKMCAVAIIKGKTGKNKIVSIIPSILMSFGDIITLLVSNNK